MMESLRGGGPINSYFFGEKMSSSECLEQAAAMDYHPQVSFLQMLNGAATQYEEGETEQEEDKKQLHFQIQQRFDFQRLLEIQERYKRMNPIPKIEPFRPPPAADSCVTHALPLPAGPAASAKKRKRMRAPPPSTRKPQEAESQRMNHIAVERNRRRLMNSHLATLRSLMPASFVQRGDQASIVAGAIDFVKDLEQLLLSLQSKKRMRAGGGATATASSSSASSSCSNDDDACHVPAAAAAAAASAASGFFISPQYTGYTGNRQGAHEGVDVEATVVQGHVNLKVVGRRRRGQLLRAVAAMEEIGLTVLHINITSLDDCSILYSLNLKIEEGCKLGSADDIATAVHQIFTYISACCHCQ